MRAANRLSLIILAGFTAFGCAPDGHPEGPHGDTRGLSDCSASETRRVPSVFDLVSQTIYSSSYTPLALDAMNAITSAARALDRGDLLTAVETAPEAGYRITPLLAAETCYWVLEPVDAATGQATLLFARSWTRNLVIEAPHAHDDHRSGEEAALLFENLGAKAVLISGSHRCAMRDSSGCRPSTQCDPVNAVPAESDPAHSIHNALNAMHLAFRTTEATVLQLHTNHQQALNGDAMVSNGTRYSIQGTPADALYEALRAAGGASDAAPSVDVRSCNDPAAPVDPSAFCGETSTQSLASNGAADQCLGRPSSAGGPAAHRFIHLEQSYQQMDAVEAWATRIGAGVALAIPRER